MQLLRLAVILLIVCSSAEESCTSNSSCKELQVCHHNKCIHKDLFPLAAIEYIGTIIILIVSCVANAGGIGGSSITISLMLLLFYFNAHEAIANTQVFIFAGTFAATILKIKDRHPTKDRSIIYYDVLMLIMSPLILGVSIGAILHPSFPEWLILGLVTLLVIFLLWDIIGRAKSMYYKEKSAVNAIIKEHLLENDKDVEEQLKLDVTSYLYEALSQNTIAIESQNVSIHNSIMRVENEIENKSFLGKDLPIIKEETKNYILVDGINFSVSVVDQEKSQLENQYTLNVQSIYKQEKRIVSCIHLTYFILLASISIMFAILKGSSSNPSFIGISPCTIGEYSLTGCYIVLLIVMMLFSTFYLARKTNICENGGYDFDEGDIHWNYRKCIALSLFGVGTGLIVGLLGIGSGVIIGPLLLSLGVRPEVSTISSSFSIFISSGIAAVQFFIIGELDINYAAWFFGISIIGSIIGILILRKIAIKRKRVSILVICIGVILLLSLIIIPAVGIMNAIEQSNNGNFQLGFSSIC